MKRRRIIVGLVAALVLAGTVTWLVRRDPEVHGHSLDHWLGEILFFNSDRHRAAADAFRETGPRAFPFLRRALREKDSGLRRLLFAVDDRFDFVDFHLMRDHERRRAALEVVRVLGPAAAPLASDILASLCDPRVAVPSAPYGPALASLGPEALPELMAFLTDDRGSPYQQAVVVGAVTWLVGLQELPVETAQTLVAYAGRQLSSEHTESVPEDLAAQCLLLLARLGPAAESEVGKLVECTRSDSTAVRMLAVEALATVGRSAEGVVPVLAHALADEDPLVRLSAAKALARFGPDAAPATPALAEALQVQSISFQLATLGALRQIGAAASNALPAVLRIVASPNETVRARAADVLGVVRTDPDIAVPVLIGMLQDADRDVKITASSSLGNYGAAAAGAVPALVAQLETGVEPVQIAMIQALGQIGPAAEPAIPSMRLAWHSNQSALGPHVQLAIARITGQPVPPSPSP